jgi:citrate lyase beta subunit
LWIKEILKTARSVVRASAFAAHFSEDEVKAAQNHTLPSAANELANEKLRTAINKLVSNAKAGKIAPAPRPQTQTRNSNNLSKGTKIAIAVGVVVAVVAIIVVAKADKGPSGPITVF